MLPLEFACNAAAASKVPASPALTTYVLPSGLSERAVENGSVCSKPVRSKTERQHSRAGRGEKRESRSTAQFRKPVSSTKERGFVKVFRAQIQSPRHPLGRCRVPLTNRMKAVVLWEAEAMLQEVMDGTYKARC